MSGDEAVEWARSLPEPSVPVDEASLFYIREGMGCINHEPVTTDVTVEDLEPDGYHSRGMRIDAGNGYFLSVVFGFGTYCEPNRWEFVSEEATSAEIAVLVAREIDGVSGIAHIFDERWNGDSVLGWQTAREVLYWLSELRKEPHVREI